MTEAVKCAFRLQKAYQELERQGVIETIRGKGTFIASEIKVKRIGCAYCKIEIISGRRRKDLTVIQPIIIWI